MNSKSTGLRVASLIFGLFGIAHVVRLFNHATVMVVTYEVPMMLSWVALVIAIVLCIWMWRLSTAGQ